MCGTRAAETIRRGLVATSPLLQSTAAVTAAWVIAERAAGHPDPLFAPITAMIALGFERGERGLGAVRVVVGVVIGVAAGELGVVALGSGARSLALTTFAAMAFTHAMGADRLIRNQAAASAIITVALAGGQAGVNRLVDVLIGAAVALVFTQVLFSPEPVALLCRTETAALTSMRDGLEATAEALERGGDSSTAQVVTRLRNVSGQLGEIGWARGVSVRVARRSVLWRARLPSTIRVEQNSARIELLGASCLMLMRSAVDVGPSGRHLLAPRLRQLAHALTELATDIGDTRIRNKAVDIALDAHRRLAVPEVPGQLAMTAAAASLRMVTFDLIVFAGVEPRVALTALQERT